MSGRFTYGLPGRLESLLAFDPEDPQGPYRRAAPELYPEDTPRPQSISPYTFTGREAFGPSYDAGFDFGADPSPEAWDLLGSDLRALGTPPPETSLISGPGFFDDPRDLSHLPRWGPGLIGALARQVAEPQDPTAVRGISPNAVRRLLADPPQVSAHRLAGLRDLLGDPIFSASPLVGFELLGPVSQMVRAGQQGDLKGWQSAKEELAWRVGLSAGLDALAGVDDAVATLRSLPARLGEQGLGRSVAAGLLRRPASAAALLIGTGLLSEALRPQDPTSR